MELAGSIAADRVYIFVHNIIGIVRMKAGPDEWPIQRILHPPRFGRTTRVPTNRQAPNRATAEHHWTFLSSYSAAAKY